MLALNLSLFKCFQVKYKNRKLDACKNEYFYKKKPLPKSKENELAENKNKENGHHSDAGELSEAEPFSFFLRVTIIYNRPINSQTSWKVILYCSFPIRDLGRKMEQHLCRFSYTSV